MLNKSYDIEFSQFGFWIRDLIKEEYEGRKVTAEEIDEFIQSVSARCKTCGYELSFNQRKTLTTFTLQGFERMASLVGLGQLTHNKCPNCRSNVCILNL